MGGKSRTLTLAALAVSGAAMWGCEPSPQAATAKPPAATPTAAARAPPPKMMKMICRNSQTGASVECGTPNAVMVGMKPA
jgi:hypothetical protein